MQRHETLSSVHITSFNSNLMKALGKMKALEKMKTLVKYVCVVICLVKLSIIFLLTNTNLLDSIFTKNIHKRLHDIPGRPVISNCGFHTENMSSFLDYHFGPLAQRVRSYIIIIFEIR